MKIFCSVCPGRPRRSLALFFLLLAVMAAGRIWMTVRPGVQPAQAAVTAVPKKQSGKTEEDRQKFIRSLGWETGDAPLETAEVTVPKKFDDVYTVYNELQLSQGLDLTRCRGKTCTRYTYAVLNHPQQGAEVRLHLLVCKGKIVGGDVCSLGLDGFQQALLFPQEEQEPNASSVIVPEST